MKLTSAILCGSVFAELGAVVDTSQPAVEALTESYSYELTEGLSFAGACPVLCERLGGKLAQVPSGDAKTILEGVLADSVIASFWIDTKDKEGNAQYGVISLVRDQVMITQVDDILRQCLCQVKATTKPAKQETDPKKQLIILMRTPKKYEYGDCLAAWESMGGLPFEYEDGIDEELGDAIDAMQLPTRQFWIHMSPGLELRLSKGNRVMLVFNDEGQIVLVEAYQRKRRHCLCTPRTK